MSEVYNNIEEIIPILRSKLVDYLSIKNGLVNTKKPFKCLWHDDTGRPNMNLNPKNGYQTAHCFACLPGSQEIKTVNGFIPISEVSINDLVFTLSGELGTIKNKIDNGIPDSLLEIKLSNTSNYGLKFTDNHPMIIVKNMIDKVPYLWENKDKIVTFMSRAKNRRTISKYNLSIKSEVVRADQIEAGDYFIHPKIKSDLIGYSTIKNTYIKNTNFGPKIHPHIENIPINEETMWLFGLYCAEGNTFRGGITFTLHEEEVEYYLKIKSIIEKYFNRHVGYFHKVESKGVQITCSSTDLEHFFSNTFGRGSENKTAPMWFIRLPINLQKSFLTGLFDGDGSDDGKTLTVTSKKLVDLGQQIAINLEIPFSRRYKESYIPKDGILRKATYTLYLRQQESIECFYETVDDQIVCLQRIESISKIKNNEHVFDIEVTGSTMPHTFLCQDYAVHNCNRSSDIFSFANKIEGLPVNGPEWLTVTIPSLCDTLKISYNFGEPTQAQKDKSRLYKLCRDIADIIDSLDYKGSYGEERGWSNDKISMGSIDEITLIDKLVDTGWSMNYLISSGIIKTKEKTFFGKDKFTFVIEDPYKRPIGFISRNLRDDAEEKYIHTFDTVIFRKARTLFGLGIDLNRSKTSGTYIVEGSGDVASLATKGLLNTCGVMGTALSEEHLLELKKTGVRKVILCFDWDDAGKKAISRAIETVIPKVQDISYYIKVNNLSADKDPDEFLKNHSLEEFHSLPELSIFEYLLHQLEGDSPEIICEKMLPLIATENSAIRRSLMTQALSASTHVPIEAIEIDISALRDRDLQDKKLAMVAAAQEFQIQLEQDPNNYITLMSNLEEEVNKIEKKYNKAVAGISYQLQKYEDIQKTRELNNKDNDNTSFKFGFFKDFETALSGGMPYTRGCLIYAGGRSNAGKTLACIAYGVDVALHDENAMVIIHSIDDSYEQIEPRIKTNLYNMYYRDEERPFILDMAVSPYKYSHDFDVKDQIKKADELFRQLLFEERLIILDSNDGSNLTSLEKHWRYYRTRHPSKKLFGICDNTHDYEDFSHLDRTAKMTLISSGQKKLATKYNACLLATAEYRKSDRSYADKILFPTNDDLADARALSYRPNIIFHVYNDLADRGDKAEIFWIDPSTGERCPRVFHLFTKNKINSFKGKLVRDINKLTVSCIPRDFNEAKKEQEDWISGIPKKAKQEMKEFENDLGFEMSSDFEE